MVFEEDDSSENFNYSVAEQPTEVFLVGIDRSSNNFFFILLEDQLEHMGSEDARFWVFWRLGVCPLLHHDVLNDSCKENGALVLEVSRLA
ncbi:hypothetical protein SUGI_1054440 [Cryptomeria japonica]|nr:hypothetical protein SUGI_1054440 [Cryptomeria japonica]